MFREIGHDGIRLQVRRNGEGNAPIGCRQLRGP
jgi:hypothetical protein